MIRRNRGDDDTRRKLREAERKVADMARRLVRLEAATEALRPRRESGRG